MHGVVSLLPQPYYMQIEDLWAELKHEFGVEGVYVTPYPHFSYQVAGQYDLAALEPILRTFAALHTPYHVSTAGLGLFTGASPVLYIPLARGPELATFQQALWQALLPATADIQHYYHPQYWMPHITIGFGDLTNQNLAAIMRYLSSRNFNWQMTIDNLALIYDTGTKQELRCQFSLSK